MRQLIQAVRLHTNRRGPARVATAILLGAAAGCGQAPAAAPPPAPTVVVSQPTRRTVTLYEYATGTTRATEAVEVKARVSGELREIHFEPSHPVNKGDVLFLIEPERYQAARNEAYAALKSAEADLARAQSDLKRADEAAKSSAIAEADLDLAKAKQAMAEAGVLSANARLENAELELSYTQVLAPISGQVGRNLVDVGNVVSATTGTPLTTINKLRPIFVYFNAPEVVVAKALRRLSKSVADPFDSDGPAEERQAVFVATLIDDDFPHEGVVDMASVAVDEITVIGSRCGPIPTALAALADGSVKVDDLLDDRFAIADAPAAFSRAAERGVGKVLLTPEA